MNISKICIKGFRSYSSTGVTIDTGNDLNAFIGSNSSGKTAALESLMKLFGTTSKEREIHRIDFHTTNDENPETIEEKKLSIEVKINFKDKAVVPHFFNHMLVDKEKGKPYVRIRLESIWTKNEFSQEGDIDTKLYFINVSEGEVEDDEVKKIFPKHLRKLIQFYYVPAIRQASDQIKYISGTILYRVLKLLNFSDDFKTEYETQIDTINTLFTNLDDYKVIQGSISKYWNQFHTDKRYNDASLSFGSSEIESILKKLEIEFSPSGTHKAFKINDLGDGYRSLFYLSLVCTLLEVEETISNKEENTDKITPILTILAIEEPENHIAPQLLGRIIKILRKLSKQSKSQVFLSSHTPAIIKRIEPHEIFHFRIDENETNINTILLPEKTDEAYKYIKEAIKNYPELYFAKLAVIGEGDSEEIIFNKLMEVYDVEFDDHYISFAPLGHRFVNHIWKLLDNLEIPYITLLDLDIERNGGGWGRIKYIVNQLLEYDYDKDELLECSDETVMTDEELKVMHTKVFTNNNLEEINFWIEKLEDYDVYYSTPLDLDFLLLKHYPEAYKKAIPDGGGPRIPTKDSPEFNEKLSTAIKATLKSENAKALTFSEEDKELMIWYNYHFLGRGKPLTHINAFINIEDDKILEKIPDVFKSIFKSITEHIEE